MRDLASAERNRLSVERFPVDRTAAMTRDRVA